LEFTLEIDTDQAGLGFVTGFESANNEGRRPGVGSGSEVFRSRSDVNTRVGGTRTTYHPKSIEQTLWSLAPM